MLVLDFGGQYSQLIARRVREARVYSELVSHRLDAEAIRARRPLALVLSGGPASVYAEGAPLADPAIFDLGVPTLGICYGMQLMARELGGVVESNEVSEFGKADVELRSSGVLFRDLQPDQVVWMSHRDSVTAPPEGSRVVASSPSTPIAAFEHPERRLYGVQFHPEVVHTPYGNELLKNFLYAVADAPAQLLRHELHAVADPQGRNPEPEDARVDLRGALGIDRSGPARQHQRERIPRPELLGRDAVRDELRVDAALPHPARDQLRVLAAAVQNEHRPLFGGRLRRWQRDDVAQPMPTFCDCWSTLPSVLIDGASMISAFWKSWIDS